MSPEYLSPEYSQEEYEKGIEKGKVEVAHRLIANGMTVEEAAEIVRG
jgi:hypothetical protein